MTVAADALRVGGSFYFLRIAHDRRFDPHIRVWVARLTRLCPTYGVARQFVEPMTDWRGVGLDWQHRPTQTDRVYALREGWLYEVLRPHGRRGRQSQLRRFLTVQGGRQQLWDVPDVLQHLAADTGEDVLSLPDAPGTTVGRVSGLGAPDRLGWVTHADQRHYLLARGGVYEVRDPDRSYLVGVDASGTTHRLTHQEAWMWLCENGR